MKTTTKDPKHRYWRGEDGKLLLVCPTGTLWQLGAEPQPTWRDNIR